MDHESSYAFWEKATTSSNSFAPTNYSSLREKNRKKVQQSLPAVQLLENQTTMHLMQEEKIRLDQLLDSILCLMLRSD